MRADPYLLAGRADRLLKLHQHLLHPVDAELLGDLAYQPVETLAEWPESKNQLYALEEEFGPPDPGPWQNVDVLVTLISCCGGVIPTSSPTSTRR